MLAFISSGPVTEDCQCKGSMELKHKYCIGACRKSTMCMCVAQREPLTIDYYGRQTLFSSSKCLLSGGGPLEGGCRGLSSVAGGSSETSGGSPSVGGGSWETSGGSPSVGGGSSETSGGSPSVGGGSWETSGGSPSVGGGSWETSGDSPSLEQGTSGAGFFPTTGRLLALTFSTPSSSSSFTTCLAAMSAAGMVSA